MGGMSIFGALHVLKDGLFVQQAGIGVTSHNIANVNTPGFSKQKPVIETMDAQQIGGIYFGRGARLTTITKSYDRFLNNNIILETTVLGKWEAQETYMLQAETIFNESNEIGLNAKLNEFWNAWQDLADHPEGVPERAILQSIGQSIGLTFRTIVADLESIRSDANTRLASVVENINILTEEIAQLNAQLLGNASQRANANDLTDKRSIYLEELAKLIDINVIEEADGQVAVLTSSGKPLVSENNSFQLVAQADVSRDNMFAIRYSDGDRDLDITDSVTGGQLKGYIEIRDDTIPDYIDKIDLLAAALMIEVNRVHYSGYGLDGSTGNYFFNPTNLYVAADSDNSGGAIIYDSAIEDPTKLLVSEFDITFLGVQPVTSKYEVYDSRNEEYIFNIDAGNATIVFDDSAAAGEDSIASLEAGTYTGDELAAEIERQLEANSYTGQNYTVTYDDEVRKFSITNSDVETLTIKWDDANTKAGSLLGYSGTSTIASDDTVTGSGRSGLYTYGDNLFEITTGSNDQIYFNDGSGAPLETATLSEGVYTGEEMAAEIENELNATGGGAFDVSVTYEKADREFIITINNTNGGTVDFYWSNAVSTAATILGFDGNDTTGLGAGDTDESDNVAGNYRYFERLFDISGSNNTIVFEDGGVGDGTGGTTVTATLSEGRYTGEELAAEIERQLETTVGSARQDYIVTFDVQHGTFTIINKTENVHDIEIDWAGSSAAGTLGFDAVTDTVTVYPNANSFITSDDAVGRFVEYKKIYMYGMSAKISDGEAAPQSGDVFTMSTIKDAAELISIDDITATDTDKIAAAQRMFDIDGTNNTIIFTDEIDFVAGTYYKVTDPNGRIVIPNGSYTPDELAAEIERQLEQNGSDVFEITTGVNDTIDFDDGTASTAILTAGFYNGDTLAAEIENQLEAASVEGSQFTVTYDKATKRFSITYDSTVTGGNLDLEWSTSTIASMLGFDTTDTTNITVGSSDTSDSESVGQHRSYSVYYDSTAKTFNIVNNPDNVNPLYLLWEHEETNAGFTLGFEEKIFTISEGANDTIIFDEGGADIEIILPERSYTGEELAEKVQELMNESGTQAYTVTYDNSTRSFTVINNGENNMTIHWSDTDVQDIALEMGFAWFFGDDTVSAGGGSSNSDFTPHAIYTGASSMASSDFQTGGAEVGDNRNALELGDVKDLMVLEKNTLSIDSYYSVITSEVGHDVENTNRGLEHQEFMIEEFEKRRQSVAGVSIDEELINLMKFQQAYAATAKLISAIDEMLNILISLKK